MAFRIKSLSIVTTFLKWLLAAVGAVVLFYVGFSIYGFFSGLALNPNPFKDKKPTSTPDLPDWDKPVEQKDYVDSLASKGERPTNWELVKLWAASLNPFRRL